MTLFRGAAVLRERDFRLLFAGQGVSHLGDRIALVALAFAVLDLTGSASGLGLVLAARSLPMVLFLLAGGVVADRLPRRLVLLASDLVRAVVQATLAFLLLAGVARLWEVVALQAAYGVADAFFNPAATGIVPKAVPPERLQEANAMLGLARSGVAIAGPLLAGGLVVLAGAGTAIAIDAATFVGSAWCLFRMRAGRDRVAVGERGVLRELAAGWKAFTAKTWLWASVLYFGLANALGFGAFFVLGPLVAKQSLGGAGAWGVVVGAAGFGSLAGGLAALRLRARRPLLAGYLAVLPAFPLMLGMLALPARLALVAAATALGQAAFVYFGIVWSTALQEHVPDESLARVSSYDWLVSYGLQPVGFAAMGPLAALLGVADALWLAAAAVLAATAAVLAAPSVRALGRERFPTAPG